MAPDLEERQEAPAPQPELHVVEAVETPVVPVQALQASPAPSPDPAPAADPVPVDNSVDADTAPTSAQHSTAFTADYGYAPEKPKNDNNHDDNEPRPLSGRTSEADKKPGLHEAPLTAVNGKQMLTSNFAANQSIKASAMAAELAQKHRQEEAQRITQWNATQIVMGGVSMTNAQALNALQKINSNPDRCADRAVQEGRIKKGDEEEFKRTSKRMQELMEKEKAGNLTGAELKEKTKLEHSTMGQTVAKVVGTEVERDNIISQKANLERTGTSFSPTAVTGAPPIQTAFAAAVIERQVTAQPDAATNRPAANVEQIQRNNATIPGIA